ncbi:MAG: hypothetical protein PVF73_02530 [Bacteroidales bacterium]|jgi:hypothetical protein
MFFFSGFSSFFPYILYISAIWVCVLIGFRGRYLTLFSFTKQPESITLNEPAEQYHVIDESVYTDDGSFVTDASDDHISQEELNGIIRYWNNFKIKYFSLTESRDDQILFSCHFLRAPPFII